LIKDDLPTLERPAKAISGIEACGYCGGQTALLINSKLVIFMFKYAFISTDGFQGLALRGIGAV
jgi:hypothetical protein